MLRRFDGIFLQSILGVACLIVLSGFLLAGEFPFLGLLLGVLSLFRLAAVLLYVSLKD